MNWLSRLFVFCGCSCHREHWLGCNYNCGTWAAVVKLIYVFSQYYSTSLKAKLFSILSFFPLFCYKKYPKIKELTPGIGIPILSDNWNYGKSLQFLFSKVAPLKCFSSNKPKINKTNVKNKAFLRDLPDSSCRVVNLSVLSTAVIRRATQIIHDCKSEKTKLRNVRITFNSGKTENSVDAENFTPSKLKNPASMK